MIYLALLLPLDILTFYYDIYAYDKGRRMGRGGREGLAFLDKELPSPSSHSRALSFFIYAPRLCFIQETYPM